MTTCSTSGPLCIEEISDFVADADRLGQDSHASKNNFLMSRWLPYKRSPCDLSGGANPFGRSHGEWVLNQWRSVSGRDDYHLDLEHDSNVTVTEQQLSRLYPFVSGDTAFIANYMIGVYFALKLMIGAPNNRLVEYGIGWGNSTCALMQSGFDLLAVDIDQKWLDLVRLRANKLGLTQRLDTFVGEFGDLPDNDINFGGALFFECFHHALNHDEALKRLTARMVEGGVILFAAEAIYKDFPIDWGVRQDGHSVWAIRRYGWMELGFSEDYFILLCRRHNLSLTRHTCEAAGPFGVIYRSVVWPTGVPIGQTLLTSRESGFYEGESDPSILSRFTKGKAKFEVPCGKSFATIELRNWLTVELSCSLRINDTVVWQDLVPAASTLFASLENPIEGYSRMVEIQSDVYSPLSMGINDDPRLLGISVGRVRLHDRLED